MESNICANTPVRVIKSYFDQAALAEEIRESKTKIINSLNWEPPRIPFFEISSGLFTRDSLKKKNFPTSSVTTGYSIGDDTSNTIKK